MIDRLGTWFDFAGHGTTLRRETIAGFTTFLTMAYIIVVNPAVLKAAGLPAGPSMVATILTTIFGTLLMGLLARRPFAIAPYMGENAFIAYTVVGVLGCPWRTALGAVFVAGALFVLLTVVRLRAWLVGGVPVGLRHAFAVGIGLFLTFIGLNETGIVTLGAPGAPVRIGDLGSRGIILSVAGFLVVAGLMIRKVPGALFIGLLFNTFLAFATGIAPLPSAWVGLPPSLRPVLFQLDVRGALSWAMFPVVLTIFVMAFVDTMGTLIGVSARAGFLDADGRLPSIGRPMMADALATCFAALVGTTTAGAYVESAAGVEAGGRTGFTAVVTASLFALTLFFAPFVAAVPPQAFGPVLIIVGLLMLAPITRIDFRDDTELIPAFAVIALMSFTFNIGIGITGGFILYPFCKIIGGRHREVRPALWALALLSCAFFIFYPYR